ncbi:2-cysteine peroxiredoxin [Lactarius indigo]|nr:2-cysteine peroxiredoxin [Lactarius indigo]
MSPAIQSPAAPVIMMFYPLDFAFVCPTDILAFNDTLPEYFRFSTMVLAISTDSEADMRIPVLADHNMDVACEYGCLIEDKGITFCASYLISSKGITTNDLPVGRSIDKALLLVQEFQFTDARGEVCYTNWKEGSKTICADPLAKLDYFAAAIVDGALENGKVNGTKRAPMDTQ